MMTKLAQAYTVLVNYGVRWLVLQALDYVLMSDALARPATRRLYWTVAPTVYRLLYPTDVTSADAPLDPFKVVPVDPAEIVSLTGRPFPPWDRKERVFGTVLYGNWDVKTDRPLRTAEKDRPGTIRAAHYLTSGERFSDSIFHRSMVDHFENGTAWEETEFVRKVLWMIEQGDDVWHGCGTREDVDRRCAELDELYESMRERGCLSATELFRLRDDLDDTFLDVMTEEVMVDVARDGELLFVDGRHRLSIAKILGLPAIPVAFAVRHPQWMAHRNRLSERELAFSHPDLRDGSSDVATGREAGPVRAPVRETR